MSELSQPELICMTEGGDLAGSLSVLRAPDQASIEDRQELFLCLRNGTLLRLFLTGIIGETGPLSGETSACVRDGFAELDLRSMMQAEAGGEGEGEMNAALHLTISCLNEAEWAVIAPGLGLSLNYREGVQCLTRELGGPEETAAASQLSEQGPSFALIAAAIGCGLSESDLAALTMASPVPVTPESSAIAPLSMEDPVAFMSELSPAEQSCISAIAEPQQLALIMSNPEIATPEQSNAFNQCLEDETLLRLFITGLIGLTSPLSVETSVCVRGGVEGIDLRSMMSGGADHDEEAAMVNSMSAFMVTLSCLNDEEWQAASAATGMDPGEREDLQCAMEHLGGPEGMAATLQSMESGDDAAFSSFLIAALQCGVQFDAMGAGPGG